MLLVYVILGVIFVATVILAVMMISGYRWNVKESHIESYGVIQVKTFPSGTSVRIGERELGFLDGQRLDLAEGKHTVSVSKQGYQTWTDEILIKGGKVKWLNVRLFPEKINTELVKNYPALLNSYEAPNKSVILNHLSKNHFELVDLTGSEPKYTDLPLVNYFADAEKYNFEFKEWNLLSQSLVFRDNSSDNKQTIMINYKEPKATMDLTERYAKDELKFETLKLTGGKGMIAYALNDGKLYRMDLAATDTPAELIAEGVREFATIDENKLAFVQNNDKDAQYPSQVILYNYKNVQPILFDRVTEGVTPRVNVVRVNENDYLVYALDKKVMIFKADGEFYNLKSAPETGKLDKTKVSLLQDKFLEVNPKVKLIYSKFFDRSAELVVTNNSRFVTMLLSAKTIEAEVAGEAETELGSNAEVFVYDIENDESHQYLYYDAPTRDAVELKWLDNVILWTKTDQGMRARYHDGRNGRILTGIKPAFGVQFGNRENDLYYFAKTDDGKFDLMKFVINK